MTTPSGKPKATEYVIDDTSYETWMRSILAHPILGTEYSLMYEMFRRQPEYAHVPDASRFGRMYQDIYRPSDNSSVSLEERFRQQAARLKEEDPNLVEIYAKPRKYKLKSESRAAMMCNPFKLLSTAFGSNGDDLLSRGRRVESLARFIISRRLLHQHENGESEAVVDDQCEEIFDLVIERLFHENASDPIQMYAMLDPNQRLLARKVQYEIGAKMNPVRPPRGLKCRHYDSTCRYVIGDEGSLLPCIFDDDAKGDVSTVLKEIRKATLSEHEKDKRRFLVVVMNEDHMRQVRQRFEEIVCQHPFRIAEVENLYENLGEKRHNVASSRHFLAVRYILEFSLPNGKVVPVEACFQLALDHANTQFSRTDARHELYRLKQLCKGYFPFRYPRFLFGVDFRLDSKEYARLVQALR